jgi:hypothetical protein
MEKYVIREENEDLVAEQQLGLWESNQVVEEITAAYHLDLFTNKNNSENINLEINKLADTIYKNYLQIKKIADENSVFPKTTMLINAIILLKIAGSFRKNTTDITQNQLLKEFITAECNITFDSSMIFNIDTIRKINHR